jgi:hypothetical protein
MFNVITPLARYENIEKLKLNLVGQNIIWHIVTDDDRKEKINFTESWINHYVCPNNSVDFWARSNFSINWLLETQDIKDEEYYCILNDDDGYSENFFEELKTEINLSKENNLPTDLVIVSMKRGDNIPPNLPPVKRHPTNTLFAREENIIVGGVGVEQFFMKGKHIKNHRLPLTVYGDGELISQLVKIYPTLYVPNLFVKFNFFEPGRWENL